MKHWKKLYDMSGTFLCPYCQKVLPMSEATLEHEPPLSRQSTHGPSRTYLACKKDNNQKGALTFDEYMQWKHLEFIRNGGLSNGR